MDAFRSRSYTYFCVSLPDDVVIAMSNHTIKVAGILLALPLVSVPVLSAPTGGNVVSGTATIGVDPGDPNRTVIVQSSQNTAINWSSFNIANNESVLFNQPNVDAIALNRDFSGSPSQIFGSLDANGNVFIINTAGVLIGAGASINVGGLLLSDLDTSNADAENFDSIASQQNWSLPFSDRDLQAGGIEVLGSIQTTGQNGITMSGQYIYIEGDITSIGAANDPGGNINFLAGGSTVMVTDPNGLYGVEISGPVANLLPDHDLLFEIPDSASGASVLAVNGNIKIEVVYEAGLPIDPGSPGLDRPGIAFDVQSISSIGDGGQAITTISRAVRSPPSLSDDVIDEVDSTITEGLVEEPEETESTLLGDAPPSGKGSLDNIVESCVPKNRSDKDCIRQNAIKRYLGKLLIGGSLPD